MVGVVCLYYFVVLPLLGGQGNGLSLDQVAGVIGSIGGAALLKVSTFGVVAFVGSKFLASAKQAPAKTTE